MNARLTVRADDNDDNDDDDDDDAEAIVRWQEIENTETVSFSECVHGKMDGIGTLMTIKAS